ncbi:MAG: DUF4332 domain-containing protein [Caldilinea sp. CFX5]|nr:DUF4332 domain-containing protein [Caldilinea sp. CFX5]
MQTVETIKTDSRARFTYFGEKTKVQPHDPKLWGVTAGGALVGAAAVAATTQGALALFALLAAPPVALTVGALGGGFMGWNYMRRRQLRGPVAPPTNGSPCAAMDDLALIHGVTAVYAARLHAAGIHTFAQLAELTPERVHLIIGPTYYGAIIHSTSWIAEAQQLANKSKAQGCLVG